MNSFIWKDGKLGAVDCPYEALAVQESTCDSTKVGTPTTAISIAKTVLFKAVYLGCGVVLQKNERRRHARAQTRGRRNARRIPKRLRFDARVFVETPSHVKLALPKIEAIADEARHTVGMPGWRAETYEERMTRLFTRRSS